MDLPMPVVMYLMSLFHELTSELIYGEEAVGLGGSKASATAVLANR